MYGKTKTTRLINKKRKRKIGTKKEGTRKVLGAEKPIRGEKKISPKRVLKTCWW